MKPDFVPFDLNDLPDAGLVWLAGSNQVWDIDAGSDGQTVGTPTGAMERFTAIGWFDPEYDKTGAVSGFHFDPIDPNMNGYCESSVIEFIAPVKGPAHPADLAENQYSIEGSVVFQRSDSTSCVCCPEGEKHVFARHVNWDTRSQGLEPHYARSADELVNKLKYVHANEGRRLRLTVELVD